MRRVARVDERRILVDVVAGEAQRRRAAEGQVHAELAAVAAAIGDLALGEAAEFAADIGAARDDVHRSGNGVAPAQRALRTLVDLDALQIVEHRAQSARARDVGAVEVRRGAGIAQFRVVGAAHAADEDFQVAFLVGDVHARHEHLQVAQLVVDAERPQILGRQRLRGAGEFLQILLAPLDRDDDGIELGGIVIVVRPFVRPLRTRHPRQQHGAQRHAPPGPCHPSPPAALAHVSALSPLHRFVVDMNASVPEVRPCPGP
jgi:hypothetical protein